MSSAAYRCPPTPRQAAPAANQARVDSSVACTFVGMSREAGLGARKLRTKAGPSNAAAGKSLTISQPSSSACAISVADPAPGM